MRWTTTQSNFILLSTGHFCWIVQLLWKCVVDFGLLALWLIVSSRELLCYGDDDGGRVSTPDPQGYSAPCFTGSSTASCCREGTRRTVFFFFALFAPIVALPAQWMEQESFQVTDLVLSEPPGIFAKSAHSTFVETMRMDWQRRLMRCALLNSEKPFWL